MWRRHAAVERQWVEPQQTAPARRRQGTIQLPVVIVSENFCAGQDAYCCAHKADHRRPLVDTFARRRSAVVVTASASVEAA